MLKIFFQMSFFCYADIPNLLVTDKNLYIFIKIWNFQYTATDLLKIIFCQKREAIEKENANVAFHHNNGVVSAVR